VSPPRQGIFQWEIPNSPGLPEAAQMRCRELLSHMLLAAITGKTEEKSDEREDPTDAY
jgi:hypothetical protein